MAEYIEHEAFKKSVEERYCKPCKAEGKDHNGCWCRACWVDDMLDEVECFQPADVVPVVHGRWEFLGPNRLTKECMCGTCSVCKVRSKYIVNTMLCPHCGAIMDGGDNNAVD